MENSHSVSPVYKADQISFNLCFLNARSLHKHIDDVRKDLNYSSTDVNIFTETRYACSDNNDIYAIDGYSLFRNDSPSTCGMRPYVETAVYSRVDY